MSDIITVQRYTPPLQPLNQLHAEVTWYANSFWIFILNYYRGCVWLFLPVFLSTSAIIPWKTEIFIDYKNRHSFSLIIHGSQTNFINLTATILFDNPCPTGLISLDDRESQGNYREIYRTSNVTSSTTLCICKTQLYPGQIIDLCSRMTTYKRNNIDHYSIIRAVRIVRKPRRILSEGCAVKNLFTADSFFPRETGQPSGIRCLWKRAQYMVASQVKNIPVRWMF